MEYIGAYPAVGVAHGNATKHKDDDYRRTNPATLQKLSELAKHLTPRDTYKTLLEENSFTGPRDLDKMSKCET